MRRHIVSRSERNIRSGLRRANPRAPEEVINGEARQRLLALTLRANELGETQPAIAARLGYSLSQVERIISLARENRRDVAPSPLLVWHARNEVVAAPPTAAGSQARTAPGETLSRAPNGGLLSVSDGHTLILAEEPPPEPEAAFDDDGTDYKCGDALDDIRRLRLDLQRRYHDALWDTKEHIGRLLLIACDLESGYFVILGQD